MTYMIIFAIGIGTWGLAKHGPFAAAYSYEDLKTLLYAAPMQKLAALPKTIFLNPAVVLVMLLAGQTGILHRTMEETMRLMDIYTVSKYAGFSLVAKVGILSIFIAAVLLTALAVILLHIQTSARKSAKKRF